jgi:hypothetical protein
MDSRVAPVVEFFLDTGNMSRMILRDRERTRENGMAEKVARVSAVLLVVL